MYPQSVPTPHVSPVLHYVIMGFIVLLLLGGGAAAGYFMRSSEVSSLQSKVSEQQAKIISLESQVKTTPSSASVFEGIQQRARDTERQTDVNSIATYIEVYFNDHAGYPSFAHLSNDVWNMANLSGIDSYALRAPNATSNSLQNVATPDATHYGYVTKNADGTVCNKDLCDKFFIYYRRESTNEIVTKNSLN